MSCGWIERIFECGDFLKLTDFLTEDRINSNEPSCDL